MNKETPIYYKKLKKKLSDCKEGEWVYDDGAHLCYVTEDKKGFRNLHYYGIEYFPGNDAIVYPLTLSTKEIMDRMTEIRNKYHKNRIMNSDISRELEEKLESLMDINDEDLEDCDSLANPYELIWGEIERTLKERLEYAKKLFIIK